MKRAFWAQQTAPLLIALLLMLSVGASLAQVSPVPQWMHFQGRLTRPDGTPVADGNYSLRFSFWTAVTGGTEKWNQTLNPVAIKNGTFAVLLNTSSGAADKFYADLWLEIKIGTAAPLTPRQQVVSVAYAMKADRVKDGGITSVSMADGAVTMGKIADNAITSAKVANGAITGADIANATITSDKFASGIFNPLVWLLGGNSGTNPASQFIGTTDNQPLELRVNNRRAQRYTYVENTSFSYRGINAQGGSEINEIAAGVIGATIAGGGFDSVSGTDAPNRVSGDFGFIGGGTGNTVSNFESVLGGGRGNTVSGALAAIGGGQYNIASGSFAFIGGGAENTASENSTTVAGGFFNEASGVEATIGGGAGNQASGVVATIPGGAYNQAAGNGSFAAGRRAKSLHDGAFVWADWGTDWGTDFVSTNIDQFLIRATGGVGIGTNSPTHQLTVQGGANTFRLVGPDTPYGQGAKFNFGDGEHIFLQEVEDDKLTIYARLSTLILGGNLGIGIANPNYKLDVNGQVNASGGYSQVSDARYKTNVQTLSDALDSVLNLRGVTFEWKREDWKDQNFAYGRQIGFLAQEVEKVLPELVNTDSNGYKSVAYQNIVPVLVEAIKTQQKQIQARERHLLELEAKNAELEARLERIEAALRSQK